MKLKELIPMLFSEDTASKHMTIRITLENIKQSILFEGEISDFYNECILKNCYIIASKYGTHRLGSPIGNFDVLEVVRYQDDTVAGDDIPKYNWPINIVIY